MTVTSAIRRIKPGMTCILGLSTAFLFSVTPSRPVEGRSGHSTHVSIRQKKGVLLRRSAPLSHQVVIADQLVMVIDTAGPGSSPEKRVDDINDRLIGIIATEPLLPGRMRLMNSHGQAKIIVGKHYLMSVTAADARANGTTVPVLAHFWLANLKKALPQARPPQGFHG